MFQHPGLNQSGFIPVAGVERRLAATGNGLRALDLMPESPENLHHADANARIAAIHETGNEHGDSHAGDRVGARLLLGNASGVVHHDDGRRRGDLGMERGSARDRFALPLVLLLVVVLVPANAIELHDRGGRTRGRKGAGKGERLAVRLVERSVGLPATHPRYSGFRLPSSRCIKARIG